ncbi:ABC transporter ATP-binding protein/permease [Candidatus Xianfuyuplasma coldseepsis]|uniref:ABC transporter ATP-binding protein/permease n=1 Tax=Candidatus Xianfuyuplasma coldseepsis TaxID=2782163 RepID=A0A7L7KSZ9_9MOLU|nr:ABC transporter ATP-binding protein/permease [Xianfuyuplasma coldseepsis]QMS84898.1 ABC transporter ATP-binding protein/permease [Xianfuyuplasma coldseepsis]
MIELRNLTKVYETVNYNIIALSDIHYRLDKGEVVVLLGKSGSGKSTLLNILGGFDREYAGHYILDGESMKEKSEREIDTIRKRKIGFVFQHYVLLNNLTVIENVELALRVIGVVNAGSRRRASLHALKLVGLQEHADKYPYELSGGQRQRVAIARAFVKNPDVIIADEPTAALDSRTSNEILELLKDLCRTKLLIIATHNKAIVRDFSSRVIELKSGYTIRDELITDPSKVRVDELDLIIDKEINQDNEIIEQLIDIETRIDEDNKATVLKDLGVDLSEFRLNNNEKFNIDDELRRRLIKERMQNSKLSTRIYRFLQTSDDFHGKKSYANKSFLRNIGLHLFSAMIFTVFLLTIVFGLNFVNETIGGFNEKALYTRTMNNENEIFFVPSVYLSPEKETDLGVIYQYEDKRPRFISDFSQTEIAEDPFFETLLDDPYFQYYYQKEKLYYIESELDSSGADDVFNIYYNNSNIIFRDTNEAILFEQLQYTYESIYQFAEPNVYVTNFLGLDLDQQVTYPFDFLYAESNEAILNKHMLEGGKLPEEADEVVIPVAYLFDYEILNPSDFKDDHGNVMEVIPSGRITEAFFELSEEERTLDITKNIITIDNSDSNYTMSYDTETTTFEVVGLINFDGDINPYLEMLDSSLSTTLSNDTMSFVFSTEAENDINFEIVDNATVGDFEKDILYAEISTENYELYEVDTIINDFDEAFIGELKSDYVEFMDLLVTTLQDATDVVADYVRADINGENPDASVLTPLVDDELFPGLTHRDLLRYYLAQHMSVVSDVGGLSSELSYLCPSCSTTDDAMDMLDNADTAYIRLKQSSQYIDVLENYGDYSRLTYQESTNLIIFNEYGHRLSNLYETTANDENLELRISRLYLKESGSISSLIYIIVPRSLLETFSAIDFIGIFINMIERLESNERFVDFLETTNLDILISSLTTNAIRSIVMVILYVVIYVILFVSVAFLSIVLINLYGNIYETATRRRIKELASLRVLGTSYEDIHSMVQLENRRVALFSYGGFVVILFLLSRLEFFTNAPISHFYMPLLGLFFDFNLYDVFVLNAMVIVFVSLLFYLFIYKLIIKRVSTRKIANIDTIQAIRDGDNL